LCYSLVLVVSETLARYSCMYSSCSSSARRSSSVGQLLIPTHRLGADHDGHERLLGGGCRIGKGARFHEVPLNLDLQRVVQHRAALSTTLGLKVRERLLERRDCGGEVGAVERRGRRDPCC